MHLTPTLSLIIPCYNECGSIPSLIANIEQLILQLPTIEIILVNNGSTDDTAVLLNSLALSNHYNIVNISINKGYGHGILQGLQVAKAPVLAFTHADMQTHPLDVLLAYNAYIAANNIMLVVKGLRQKRNWLDAAFTKGMSWYSSVMLQVSLTDVNAQPKLFSSIFYKCIKEEAPLDFSLDVYLLYKAKTLGSIHTIPVLYNKRKQGSAKGGGTLKGKWKLIKRTVTYIQLLKKKLKH